MLRKRFILTDENLASGKLTLSVKSLGYHEVYVNGVKVGDKVMQPAVSQLNKRVLRVCYDITSELHEGDNEIIISIGRGWGKVYGTPAGVCAEVLTERLATVLETDTTWGASPMGYEYTGSWQPLRFGGERFDARFVPDWRNAKRLPIDEIFGTSESTVSDVRRVKIVESQQEFAGNRIVDTLQPKSVLRISDSILLIDFGRSLTGWFQVEFNYLAEGHEVTIDYMDHSQAVAPHTESDTYIARGHGKELFSNCFHTHSFRYVRVKGGEVSKARALQISAVDPQGGALFECSDSRLNAIHDMVKYTLSCLTFSGYMVDCPHLERMGYGGDGNSSTMTLQTLWDVRDTYRNWLTAWGDALDSSGSLPYVAPAFPTGGGPYWSGFIVKAPWRTYLNYGDRTLIDRHYNDMKRWMEYVERYSPDGLLEPWLDEGRMWFLGDWLAPGGIDVGGESALFVSNCFIGECLADMERMARLTGHEADAKYYVDWRRRLLKKLHETYYHADTQTYANGTPIDMSYALLAGVVPDKETYNKVEKRLLHNCHTKYNDHIAVGLMGVPVFTEWVIQNRHTELMAKILRQPDHPGYLYMIEQGATTTWESWECGQPGKEDRSRIHNCYNGVGIWFYQALAGIRPDPENPGYRHFYVDPQRCQGVTWIKVTKPTVYGDIKVDINDNRLRLTVPPGTTATVFPGTTRERLLDAGEWGLEIMD